MLTDLDQSDDEETPEFERITDPIINRYAKQLHELTWALTQETEHYPLNRAQVNQFIDTLTTLRALLVFAHDLERLDGVLRMNFPDVYYNHTANLVSMLTDIPLSTKN
ncbi:hypothetical protein GO755_38695 [Spirosoma sp. HMF4905]|uniref:Uncharacterized protein n=1 Tax=Spirosoma arboris TaxID=2682092 RepID=A0A7K1SQF1_9BACT|nr:hypothetical protein [Spirosoma arboris]MVM36007.1 hypothetical protein [Spirosoma arboris]